MTATAEPDWDRFPWHPVGSWERALVYRLAGVPVTPEDAAALAAHDRRPDKDREYSKAMHRRHIRVVRALRHLVNPGEVVSLDYLAGCTEDPDSAADLLRRMTPVGATVGEDERRPHRLAGGGHGLSITYLSGDLFTVSGHFLARGPLALLAFRGKHLRKGRTDPLSLSTATPQALETTPAPVPGPAPVTVTDLAALTFPEPIPEPETATEPEPVPEVTALDPVTAAVKRSARRVLRDQPGLTVPDLAVEVWVNLDGDLDEDEILKALETLGHTDNDQHLEGAA
ncbi:hypothetical protein [Corynebacterium sp.]|uniref:hypothetical protein n=1 Tax=Corynebacterium sp. TaxID=1720 RepID=UPI0028AA564F|nr:hypothetical protein [Corynebacterium sp.]